MKKKKIDWSRVPWTPFVSMEVPDIPDYGALNTGKPNHIASNSRYQVAMWFGEAEEPWGKYIHLSIKTLDRAAHHDWRDFQRLKNELVGPEYDAMEIYPAESKLVDTSNQYHLFVFHLLKFPFGFQTRLVGDGAWRKSRQRPFEVRPDDCLSSEEFHTLFEKVKSGEIR